MMESTFLSACSACGEHACTVHNSICVEDSAYVSVEFSVCCEHHKETALDLLQSRQNMIDF